MSIRTKKDSRGDFCPKHGRDLELAEIKDRESGFIPKEIVHGSIGMQTIGPEVAKFFYKTGKCKRCKDLHALNEAIDLGKAESETTL